MACEPSSTSAGQETRLAGPNTVTMKPATRGPRSVPRVFARYAVVALLPVVALGIVLADSIGSEANRRGLAEGRSEAVLVARTAVEPLLEGLGLARPLRLRCRAGLSPGPPDGARRSHRVAVTPRRIRRGGLEIREPRPAAARAGGHTHLRGGHRPQLFQRLIHQSPESRRIILLHPAGEGHVKHRYTRLRGQDRRVRRDAAIAQRSPDR